MQIRDGRDRARPRPAPAAARHELARHLPHGGRGGPHPPAALGADDARHPDRHRRGDADRRPRPGRAAPRCSDQINELGTNLLVVSPGSTTSSDRRARRLRLGVDADPAGRRRAAAERRRARRAGGRRASTSTTASLTVGTTNWTTTLTGTTPSWQQVRSRDGRRAGRFITAADEADAAAVVVLGPDTASELFDDRRPGRPDRHATTAPARRSSACSTPLSSSESTSNNDLAIVPLTTYAQRLVGGRQPQLGQLDLREGDRRPTRCRPRTRRPNALLLNLHGITDARQRRLLDRHPAVDPRRGDIGRRRR